jgi:hypothetical protein
MWPTSAGIPDAARDVVPAAPRMSYLLGAVRAVTVADVPLALCLLSTAEGSSTLVLYRLDTRSAIGRWGYPDDYVFVVPDEHIATYTIGTAAYSVLTGRRNGYTVHELTSRGLVQAGSAPALGVRSAVAGERDGRLVVFATDGERVHTLDLFTGVARHHPWIPPVGWEVSTVVTVGRRTYAWLERRVTDVAHRRAAPADERYWWHWLWDVAGGTPVGRPQFLRGYHWGPWPLGPRPAMLLKADWRRYEVRDVALGTPVGPALPADVAKLSAPAAGLLHGRPALSGHADGHVRLWDLATGEQRYAAEVAQPPLATAVAPGGVVVVLGPDGTVTTLGVPLRAVHPSALR